MYEGPGLYQHYKGGHYLVLGLAQHESSGFDLVIYTSLNPDHQRRRLQRGSMFVARPLNVEDIEDADREGRAFNDPVRVGSESQTARFTKVA